MKIFPALFGILLFSSAYAQKIVDKLAQLKEASLQNNFPDLRDLSKEMDELLKELDRSIGTYIFGKASDIDKQLLSTFLINLPEIFAKLPK